MEQSLKVLIPLFAAWLLDLALGDPRWLPHPIRLFGWLIACGEKMLNKGNFRFLKGAVMSLFLVAGVFIFLYLLMEFSKSFSLHAYYGAASLLLFFALANKSLIEEGRAVFDVLKLKGLEAGSKRLSWIVGRETKNLSAQQIRTAVLETMSENLSDGVIAPLFYFALFGVPGALAYKMINTLDSMIGYKNERHLYFGKFAARLDDVANYIPARLTAFLMIVVSYRFSVSKTVLVFGPQHASPNAGYPEAALAGIMQCRFGGPNYYHGKLVEKPYIGYKERSIKHEEFNKVASINHKTTLAMVSLIMLIYFII